MNFTASKNQRASRINRIKAAKAARNIPTAVLLTRKAECDAKSLEIVKQLIEPNVKVEWLLQNLGQINRTHLEDVVEERAIIKLCGYVLCDNPLLKIVNKKYKISTLRNKVYDIEKVKNFCSYMCYSAMDHLMIQMLTSPLWLRSEEEIPKFTILPQCKQNKCLPGVEVNIMGIELPVDNDVDNGGSVFSNENSMSGIKLKKDTMNPIVAENHHIKNDKFSQASFNEINITDNNENNQLNNEGTNQILLDNASNTGININLPVSESITTIKTCADNSKSKTEFELSPFENLEKSDAKKSEIQTGSPINISKSVNVSQSNFTQQKRRIKKESGIFVESIATRIEQSFKEWITEDTINLFHGEQTNKQKIIENIKRQDKYKMLCQKLNHIQLQEEKEARSLTIQSENLKPTPDFSVLKEKAKNMELKVREFYNGKLDVEMPEKVEKNSAQIQETENIAPLTDAHDPCALRRRIFLDKINKVVPDLLHALIDSDHTHCTYTSNKIMTVKTLISTFNLSATNIVFRTAEWTLVGLLIIKMLGIIDPAINSLLQTKKATIYISMILMTYKLDSTYLDHLINSRTTPIKINSDLSDENY